MSAGRQQQAAWSPVTLQVDGRAVTLVDQRPVEDGPVDQGPVEQGQGEQRQGDPVLLVHGALSDYRYWSPQIDALAARHRIVAPSLRHHYPERWTPGAAYTVATHVADLFGLASALGLGPVHLLGHSRGAAVALRFALDHPNRIRSLVLVDPAVLADADPGRDAAQALANAGNEEGALASFIDATTGAGTWARLKAVRRQRASDNASTLLPQFAEPQPVFDPAELDRLAIPMLLIAGENSPGRYRRGAEWLASRLPTARTIVVAGASHGVTAERAATVNATLLDFWGEPVGAEPRRGPP